MSTIPITFTYRRQVNAVTVPPFHVSILSRGATFTSWLWSIWLRAPQKLRGFVYELLIRYFGNDTTSSPFVYKLPFGIYAKVGRAPDEALAMEFVRSKTTIPVPTVLDHICGSWSASGSRPWLIVMTALPGRALFNQGEPIRLGKATEQQRIHIMHVLTDWLDQLRRITPPHPQKVCGLTGGSLFSYRIDLAKPVGPFANPTEFHAQDFCAIFPNANLLVLDELTQRLMAERPAKHYRICLTHGDILPHNILADENFIPTGLIDWECAAWMPEYWERAASFRSHFSYLYAWKEIVLDGFPEYDDDMKLEAQIQTWYCP